MLQASETELDRINSDVNGESTESTASGSDECEVPCGEQLPPEEAVEHSLERECPQEVPCADAEPLSPSAAPESATFSRVVPPVVEVSLADDSGAVAGPSATAASGARPTCFGGSSSSSPPPARKRAHSFSPEMDPFVLWYRETTAVRVLFILFSHAMKFSLNVLLNGTCVGAYTGGREAVDEIAI